MAIFCQSFAKNNHYLILEPPPKVDEIENKQDNVDSLPPLVPEDGRIFIDRSATSKFVVDTHPISHCFETSLQFHARFSFRHAFLISFLFVFLKILLFFGLSNFP